MTPTTPRRTGWRLAQWLVAIIVIVAIGFFLHRPTQDIRLADGRRFDLLQFDRNTQILVDPRGVQIATEQRLLVKYYSEVRDVPAMLAEARGLAPSFFRVADSLGLPVLLLQPSRPLLTRAFPLAVISYHVRFVRDSAGQWREPIDSSARGGA